MVKTKAKAKKKKQKSKLTPRERAMRFVETDPRAIKYTPPPEEEDK
jgi:hypothetical protein